MSEAKKPASTPRRAPKPAPAYRKPLASKIFEKRHLALLELPQDLEFFRSCFELKDGAYALRPGLEAAELQRLNKLAKAIKANRGLFKAGPLIALVLLLGGGAAFGLVFMNPLLARAAELGLRSAFDAAAEVRGLRFSPFSMRFSIESIAVADRDAPMTNLFETGRVEFRLNPAAFFRGKVDIEKALAASIAVGTPRKSSGALPEQPARAAREKPAKAAGAPLVDFQRFDAAALLEREKAKLKSTAAYEEAGAAYEEAVRRWDARVAASRKALAELDASSRAVLAINPAALGKPEDIARAIADVKAALTAAQAVGSEASAVSAGVKQDLDGLAALEKSARAAVSGDIAYLKSLVDPKSGAAMAALEPSVREVLSDRAERYLYYGRRAYEMASRLGTQAEAKEREAKPPRAFRGRELRFPSRAYPRFRLGLLASSFRAGELDWQVEFRELSTDPALLAAPAGMLVSARGGAFSASAQAELDLREPAAASYRVALDCAGLTLDLGDSLADAGLGGFRSALAGSGQLAGSREDRFAADLDLRLTKIAVDGASGSFGQAMTEAIRSVDEVRAALRYEKDGEAEDFSVATNLDQLVKNALAALAKRYAEKATAEVEATMRSYAASSLEGKLASKAELDALFGAAKGDAAAADRLKAQMDQKVKDLEARAKALGAGALQGLGLPKLPAFKP